MRFQGLLSSVSFCIFINNEGALKRIFQKKKTTKKGDAPINPPDLRQRSDISFFKVQGVNKRFMIGLLRRTMRQSTGRLAPDHPRAKTS